MADHIREIVETGTLAALEKTQKDVPRSLAKLTQLETLGPKKAKQLYEHLGITSVAELQDALDSGAVQKLPGFGQKSAEKLRSAIAEAKGQARRLKLGDADQLVRPLLAYLRQAPGIEQVEVAGSLRRRKETIGDVDILVACGKPHRLDLNDVHVRRARELGVKIIINSDAHSVENLRFMRYGVDQARRGWLEKTHVVNTLSWSQFHKWLQR
jgi:DNA polymerase/3'-5' exonuclease PolX